MRFFPQSCATRKGGAFVADWFLVAGFGERVRVEFGKNSSLLSFQRQLKAKDLSEQVVKFCPGDGRLTAAVVSVRQNVEDQDRKQMELPKGTRRTR